MLFLLVTNTYSQKITTNPEVYTDFSDETSVTRITSVMTDTDFTIVTFQYATTLFEPWIMINSKTFLRTNLSKSELKVLEWGIITGDDDDPYSSLQLNEQYEIRRRTSYEFYMVFPAISEKVTSIDIVVPVQDLEGETGGFYWQGIRIQNETTTDLSISKRDYKPNNEFTPSSSGTGFAISRDGYIVTCYHVIEDASRIRIKGINGDYEKTYNAQIIATDQKNDLAILKIDNVQFPNFPYSLGSNLSDVGEGVFVLGYPQTQHLGEELKLTTGVISSRSGYRGDMTTYQISAQVLPGNSGGPLFDNNGNIIGVVNAKYIEPNVSYAVKLNYLKTLLDNSNIRLSQSKESIPSDTTLAQKVKSVRNFVYIIEVEE